MTMHILIPCKNFDAGKSRLASCLDSRSRRALCEFFLCHTLALATALVPTRNVHVVTSDPRAVGIAADYGASAIPDEGADLNAALSRARSVLIAGHCTEGALILPTDLPCASADALGAVMTPDFDMRIVPDTAGSGTNILGLSLRALETLPFAFGPDSYRAHTQAARSAGLTTQTIFDELLAFDVDEPAQYARWIAMQA